MRCGANDQDLSSERKWNEVLTFYYAWNRKLRWRNEVVYVVFVHMNKYKQYGPKVSWLVSKIYIKMLEISLLLTEFTKLFELRSYTQIKKGSVDGV
jgi:hypothetical protein